ncbi:MAG: family 10 glycosylhydrolase [Planctomycetota bacterium]|nr:family 10 glycosylhydrolase [Planctomycetota bacterium]
MATQLPHALAHALTNWRRVFGLQGLVRAFALLALASATANALGQPAPIQPVPTQPAPTQPARPLPLRDEANELRGTWITTTANDHIASPAKTASTMRRLRDVGLNTVYVEVWKNGYTQFPSKVLQRTIGVDRRPALTKQDPSDDTSKLKSPGRDLLQETLTEAHRNGLNYVAWFEYGFMAAHKDTDNHLRRMKKDWLSKDIKGNEVAPNGFVWMNPLHPEPRRFLLELVLEAIDLYDLDGVQLDDRIVWPYVTMGYDDYTRAIYAKEHSGRQPPEDHKDPAWIRWRADKVNEYARQFVREIRERRPGVLISLSPAVYPWVYENYCLEWPKWAAPGFAMDPRGLRGAPGALPELFDRARQALHVGPALGSTLDRGPAGWDEFIPQCYRFSYDAFEKTWLEQVKWMNELGDSRVHDMAAGIRVVGEGADSTWDDLRRSIELVRSTGGLGHVHWFSRGVLDVYEKELTAFYGVPARNPHYPPQWRTPAIVLSPKPAHEQPANALTTIWSVGELLPGATYRVIVRRGQADDWEVWPVKIRIDPNVDPVAQAFVTPRDVTTVEVMLDRRVAIEVGE